MEPNSRHPRAGVVQGREEAKKISETPHTHRTTLFWGARGPPESGLVRPGPLRLL